ncbi:hypothetical protein SLS62_004288 [Diatrype stigma]|uniref:Uncharacterized protein n=1 Tax=Diatrype stigma TaxID=117547 RepID=A0AAN9YQL2_9PEZI
MISTLDLSLRPRSLAELTGERALLLDELQRRDGDVRDLFARLLLVASNDPGAGSGVEPTIYDEYNDDGGGYDGYDGSGEHAQQEQQQQQRKGHKKKQKKGGLQQQWWDQEEKFRRDLRGFLHRRIENAVDKERVILLRLGELSVEIQVMVLTPPSCSPASSSPAATNVCFPPLAGGFDVRPSLRL